MTPALTSRLDGVLAAFDQANRRLVARLSGASGAEAVQASESGGWTPAQIGAHVAAFNSLLAGVVSGDAPGAQPAPDGFAETPWADLTVALQGRLETPDLLQPPSDVTREAALQALAEGAAQVAAAFGGLTEARARLTFTYAPVGTLTLPQVGEWMTAHTIRHNAQLKRVLGR